MIILLAALLLTHLLLCAFPLFLCTTDIDLLRALSCIDQECDTVVDDLRESGADRNLRPFSLFQLQMGDPHCDRNDHVLMVWKDPLLSVRGRNDYLTASAVIEHSVAVYDLQSKCIHLHTLLSRPLRSQLWPLRSRRRSFPH